MYLCNCFIVVEEISTEQINLCIEKHTFVQLYIGVEAMSELSKVDDDNFDTKMKTKQTFTIMWAII